MTDLSPLISRVEKATAPSREIDAHIRLALLVNNDTAYVAQSPFNGEWLIYAGEYNGRPRLHENHDRSIPHNLWRGEFTTSVDAAISLAERVLPNESVLMGLRQTEKTIPWARIGNLSPFDNTAPTLAIALVLATLRALQFRGDA